MKYDKLWWDLQFGISSKKVIEFDFIELKSSFVSCSKLLLLPQQQDDYHTTDVTEETPRSKQIVVFPFFSLLPSMELHKANLEAQNQAIAVASSHPTASGSGLLPAPALTSLYKHPTTQLINTAAVTTNTVNGGVMSTSTSSNNHQPANQPEAAAALLAQLAAAQAAQQQQQQHTQNPFLFMVPQTPTEVAAAQQPQMTYQVTPKLKAPSGLIAVSSGRGTDKFSPY